MAVSPRARLRGQAGPRAACAGVPHGGGRFLQPGRRKSHGPPTARGPPRPASGCVRAHFPVRGPPPTLARRERAILTTTSSLLLEGLADPANEAIWREFHERYRPVLLAFARKLGLDEDEAADAAQETLLRFVEEYRAGHYERDRGRLRSWIFTLARSRILDLVRKRGRHGPARGESVLAHVPAADELDAAWEAEWRRAVLRQGLLELRATTRIDERTLQAFERIALGEQEPARVAAELGMTPNAVYVAKHRALGQLRAILVRLEQDF